MSLVHPTASISIKVTRLAQKEMAAPLAAGRTAAVRAAAGPGAPPPCCRRAPAAAGTLAGARGPGTPRSSPYDSTNAPDAPSALPVPAAALAARACGTAVDEGGEVISSPHSLYKRKKYRVGPKGNGSAARGWSHRRRSRRRGPGGCPTLLPRRRPPPPPCCACLAAERSSSGRSTPVAHQTSQTPG